MDPDTALASMRAAIETLRNPLDPVVTDDERMKQVYGAIGDLCDSASALDGWLTAGGFAPEDWKHSERVWATKLRTAVDALTTIRERELPGPFAVRDCDVADSALRVIEGMC